MAAGSASALLKRIAALNRSGVLATPLRYSEVKVALESVGEDQALQILANLENEGAGVSDPAAYVCDAAGGVDERAASSKKRKASSNGRDSEDSATAKRIRVLNGSGKLKRQIAYDRVKDALASVGRAQAMTILQALHDAADGVRDPTSYIRAACGLAPEPEEYDEEEDAPPRVERARQVKAEPGTGVKSEELSEVDKLERRVNYLNRNNRFSTPIDLEQILPALDSIGFRQSMQVLKRLEESGTTTDPNVFIRDSVARRGWIWAKTEVIDDDEKVAKRVAWLNQFGCLRQQIDWADIADTLDSLRIPHAMVVLREVEQNAGTIENPTEYIKRVVGAAGADSVWMPVEAGDGEAAVAQRVEWLNTHGGLAAPIDEAEVGQDLARINNKDAMQILQEVEDKGAGLKDPTGYVKFKLKSKLAAAGATLGETVDDDTKIAKRIEWLNDFGGLLKDIDYNRVAELLGAAGIEHAMTLLKEVEDKASNIKNPTSFILAAMPAAAPTGRQAGKNRKAAADGGVASLASLVDLLGRRVKKPIKLSQVAGSLDALGSEALHVLQEMQEKGLGLDDPVAYIRAAAQRKKTFMAVKSEGTEEEDDVQRISKRITWLNSFGGLKSPIKANEVVGALYCLGIPQSMAIMRGLQERSAEVPNPTAYIKQAIQKANGVFVTAKEELDGGDDGEPTEEDAPMGEEEELAAEAAALLAEEQADEGDEDLMAEAAALADGYDEAVVGQPAEEEAPKQLWPETKNRVEKRVVGSVTGLTRCVPVRGTVEKKKGPLSLIKEEEGDEKETETGVASFGSSTRKANMPITPQEKFIQIRNLAVKNGLDLDELCLKGLARFPFYRAKDMIDEVLLGGRNRQGVKNPSRYLTMQIQKQPVGLGVEQGIAMELAVSLGVVLNNDALDELASIPRKEAHNLIRQLSKDPEARQDPMDYIRAEVERVRAQCEARPFGAA